MIAPLDRKNNNLKFKICDDVHHDEDKKHVTTSFRAEII